MSNCVENHKKREFAIKEKKRTARFNNPQVVRVEQAKVDGCLVKDGKKCDHYVSADGRVWYVELKGSDNAHGVEQIFSTMKFFRQKHAGLKLIGVIVSAKIPAIGSREQKKLKRCIQNRPNKIDDFLIRTHKIEITI